MAEYIEESDRFFNVWALERKAEATIYKQMFEAWRQHMTRKYRLNINDFFFADGHIERGLPGGVVFETSNNDKTLVGAEERSRAPVGGSDNGEAGDSGKIRELVKAGKEKEY